MAVGLKPFLFHAAPWLGQNQQYFYNRQRAMVRAKLLAQPRQRGPQGGVLATPVNVARLLVTVLGCELKEIPDHAGSFINLPPADGDRCPLTGAATFADALAVVLADPDRAGWLQSIRVDRAPIFAATITWEDPDTHEDQESRFGAAGAVANVVNTYTLQGFVVGQFAIYLNDPDRED
ncbi:MAG: hypothetical protein R3310_16255 [Candidatus Competibacteraceae bacterium]|nr:hypothetical protein [Candidatus Competibacteraceae bacterium]